MLHQRANAVGSSSSQKVEHYKGVLAHIAAQRASGSRRLAALGACRTAQDIASYARRSMNVPNDDRAFTQALNELEFFRSVVLGDDKAELIDLILEYRGDEAYAWRENALWHWNKTPVLFKALPGCPLTENAVRVAFREGLIEHVNQMDDATFITELAYYRELKRWDMKAQACTEEKKTLRV